MVRRATTIEAAQKVQRRRGLAVRSDFAAQTQKQFANEATEVKIYGEHLDSNDNNQWNKQAFGLSPESAKGAVNMKGAPRFRCGFLCSVGPT